MKVTLLSFDTLSDDPRRGFAHLAALLARRLEAAGMLAQVICRDAAPGAGLPAERVSALRARAWRRQAFDRMHRLVGGLPRLDARRAREALFDDFARGCVAAGPPSDLLLCTRPLFWRAAEAARARGAAVWVVSSVPHPLLNQALVRHEEIRLGLDSRGAYSDASRVERLARFIAAADRVLVPAPAIGGFTHDSYRQFMPPERLLSLERYCGLEPGCLAADGDAADARPRSSDGVTFLHISHLNLIKGIPYLLDAWRRFRAGGGRGCRLRLAGAVDPNVGRLLRSRYAGLTDVELPGFVPDTFAEYGAADVFLSPSIADAGPATILEAMAAGLPVVASRNCGFASLVSEGESGFTYAYNDVTRLAEILAWCAENRTALPRMGAAARRRLEGFSCEGCVDEILALMRRETA